MDILDLVQQRVTNTIKEWECLLYEERLTELGLTAVPEENTPGGNINMCIYSCLGGVNMS